MRVFAAVCFLLGEARGAQGSPTSFCRAGVAVACLTLGTYCPMIPGPFRTLRVEHAAMEEDMRKLCRMVRRMRPTFV